MADIVDRLRDLAAIDNCQASLEAAAEIERLRERTEYWPDNAERDAVIRHQKEEIERLRAALEPLACTCDRANGAACSRAEANCAFWNARAALEGRT